MRSLHPMLTTSPSSSTLRFERRFAHSPAKVWRALTEPAQLSQWFPFDVQLELKLGSPIRFIEKGSTEQSSQGEITELDPPRLLAFTWYDDLLRWEVQADGPGSLLIFTHTFADRAGAASFAAGWQTCLDGMAAVLAGETLDEADYAGPEWRQQMAKLHEEYIDWLGLSAGMVETTETGWQIWFERQLTQPADQVWAKLTAGATPVVGAAPPSGFTIEGIEAGAISGVDAPNWLEYAWQLDGRAAGSVRWELTFGTGHGARLLVTQHGSNETAPQQSIVLAAWQRHIEQFAKGLLEG